MKNEIPLTDSEILKIAEIVNIHRGILYRCFNKNSNGYENYGGRGIRVCKGWAKNKAKFVRDMWPRPDGMTVDRINNDRNYSCGGCEECVRMGWLNNVRWATKTEQNENTRVSVRVNVDGETKSLRELSEMAGICKETARRRLGLGWTPEQVVGIENRTNPLTSEITFQGVTLPFKDMAEKHGLTVIMLHHRLDRGMSLEEALTTPRSTRGGDPSEKKIQWQGNEYSLKDLSALYNQDYKAVYARINKLGWSLEQALGLAPKPPRKPHNKADLTPEQIKERQRRWSHTAYLNRKSLTTVAVPPPVPPVSSNPDTVS